MEKRKNTLSTLKSCRFCLTQEGSLSSLYDRSRTPKNAVTLPLQILSCVSVEVFPSDRMPSQICERCRFYMDICYRFKQICRHADETIMQYVQFEGPLDPVAWHPKLTKLFRTSVEPTKRVDKGKPPNAQAIAVTTSASNDEEESDEDEDVYNIKIRDGPDDSKETCIKVVKTGDRLHITKDNSKSKGKKDGGDRCGNIYLYTCGSGEVVVDLVSDDDEDESAEDPSATDDVEVSYSNKERKHIDVLKYKCRKCPARFLTLSKMTEHEIRHLPDPYVCRRDDCNFCLKRFPTDKGLEKHLRKNHGETAYVCVLCDQSFSTPVRLGRHVQVEHGASRPYPCKYCEKSFLKSHHYTRHMRIKHKEHVTTGTPFNDNLYHCEQCDDSFRTQDALIYHSAQHATEDLTCPLCHEKFQHVEEVSAHIKTHVEGEQFMCDLCELVFTSKEKLDNHLADKHEDEIMQEQIQDDEDSMEVDEEDDDINFNVKEEGGQLVVEVKKPDEFMITEPGITKPAPIIAANIKSAECKRDTKNMPPLEVPRVAKQATPVKADKIIFTNSPQKSSSIVVGKKLDGTQEAKFIQRVEEVKQIVNKEVDNGASLRTEKVVAKSIAVSAGASDKSLRLLEKELQELKRTNSENDLKIPAKSADVLRSSRRPQVHTSTPKPRAAEEKKMSTPVKSVEKKQPEKRLVVTKENKEPKEKETKQNSNSLKEDKETPAKIVVKNGAADKNSSAAPSSEENPRRSSRGTKVKDYAKMVNRRQSMRDSSDSDDDDEEYTESVPESRSRARRTPAKPAVAAVAATAAAEPAAPAARKRGRPRRDAPAKVKKANVKEEDDETEDEQLEQKTPGKQELKAAETPAAEKAENNSTPSTPKASVPESPKGTIVSPTGQTLKKVPIKSLPPGIKPLPLPMNARTVNQGEVCEMQIGKKMVKVQKIVMTKAEVEAMAKKGLVEMKDGTMVLKQGIKLPTSDVASLRSTLVGDAEASKESPLKKAAPTRCDLSDD